MTDTPKRLAGPTVITATAVTVYTVPASTQTIVRSIHVNNTNSSTNYTFSLGINGTPATIGNAFFSAHYVPANGSFDWSGNLVLNAGDTLQVLANTTNQLTFTASGVEVV